MAIRSLKTGLFSRSGMVGNPIILPGDYESIATIIIGDGGGSSAYFTSIPNTYQHLQIRFTIRSSSANNDFSIGINNNFAISNSSSHSLRGNASSAIASNWISQGYVSLTNVGSITSAFPSGSIGSGVIDILDYKSTNKNKTIRTIWGSDQNGAGFISINSGMFNTTAAISEVNLFNGYNWGQYSHFALYGVK